MTVFFPSPKSTAAASTATFFGDVRSTSQASYGVDPISKAVFVLLKARQRCGALVELSEETQWLRGCGDSEA